MIARLYYKVPTLHILKHQNLRVNKFKLNLTENNIEGE